MAQFHFFGFEAAIVRPKARQWPEIAFLKRWYTRLMFQNTSDGELISKTKGLVAEERRLTARVLEHLEEIERRRLHFEMGFSSMFKFCLEELGYSESEAHYRISAMRLARDVPEVVAAVEAGRLSLTNLAQAQSYFRKNETPVEAKRELLKELEGLSTRECEKKLAPERLKVRAFELDDELEADLRRIRELWGNQDLSDTEMLRKMAKLVLSRIDPVQKKRRSPQSVGAPQVPPEFDAPENRHIPGPVKWEVWHRDGGCCTYMSGTRRCASRYAIQFDHVLEYACGGTHTPGNLRLLCR